MSNKPFLKFFSPYLWKNKVLILFFLLFLSALLKGQEAFFVPLPGKLRTAETTVDSFLDKTLLSTSKVNIRKIQVNKPENWQLSIPLENEINWVLSLKKVNIWTDEFPHSGLAKRTDPYISVIGRSRLVCWPQSLGGG